MTDLLSSAMAMAMEMDMDMDIDVVAHLDPFSGYNSAASTATNTTDHDDHGCAWSAWSPVVDWTALTGGHDDFHGLIESMMDDNDNDNDTDEEEEEEEDGGGAAEDLNRNSTPSPETAVAGEAGVSNDGSTKGVRLVHLLMAAAEALGGGGESESRDLARVILVRLKELVSPTDGSNIERLAAHFSDALHSLLDCTSSAGGASYHKHGHHHSASLDHHQNDVVAAFQLLQDMSPYVKFGHFTANQAILESVIHDRRIHILDYDIMEGIQWAPLMQALASRKDGPPAPHLRITAVSRGASAAACRRSIGTVQETGRRLSAFAASLGLPFSFQQCRLDSDESFRSSAVKLVKGEALIVNCMLNLPHFSHRSAESVASFLSGAKALGPRLIALAEEDEEATPQPPPPPPSGGGDFVGRFMDLLHQYSAVYDSLEAGFPMQGKARWLVERVFLGPRIAGSLGRIYRAGRGGDPSSIGSSWGEWLAAAGFRATPLSSANVCQAKLLLGLFNDGYRVEELASNRLVLGWKSRRLFAASIWSPPPPSPSLSSDSN